MTIDQDTSWFFRHPGRQVRLRECAGEEFAGEFAMHFGDHDRTRRRVLVWQVPRNARMYPGQILRIPYLLHGDETIRDDDATLLPLLHAVMIDAGAEHGVTRSQ